MANTKTKKEHNPMLPIKKSLGVKCPSINRQQPHTKRNGKHKYKIALSACKDVFMSAVKKMPLNIKMSPMPITISSAINSFTDEKRVTDSISCI
ncbi:MAG: hypothetical protein K2O16_13545 [Lachnospiraceae bacterium]|nr:hypothetical protein [Lachnospiraceae bacterium]